MEINRAGLGNQAELKKVIKQLDVATAQWKTLKATQEQEEKERVQCAWEVKAIEKDMDECYKKTCQEVHFQSKKERDKNEQFAEENYQWASLRENSLKKKVLGTRVIRNR